MKVERSFRSSAGSGRGILHGSGLCHLSGGDRRGYGGAGTPGPVALQLREFTLMKAGELRFEEVSVTCVQIGKMLIG
jgi:hypothetical protein